MVTRGAAALAVLTMAASCGSPAAKFPDTAHSAAASAPVAAGGTRPLCQRTGHWSSCLVKAGLERSGLAPQPVKSMDNLPTLPVTPELWTVGNNGLAIYVFADSVARARAAATLDTAKFIPPTREVGMRGEATAIANDNVLGILFSRNEHQRERVSDALLAGAPQP